MSASPPASPSVRSSGRDFANLVRFSHTVFGLPFAVAATLLAHRYATSQGALGLRFGTFLLILLAFTAARTAAMGFNRLVDRQYDAKNPRTKDREIPRGAVSVRAAIGLTAGSALVFVIAAALLGPIPLALSPVCLIVVLGYSYFKRFSWSSHLVLGAALALAPGGAWVATTGSLEGATTPLWLMLAVATWVGGFDMLYSLADRDFDREHGLHSIPVRFGIHGTLLLSGLAHVGSVAALVALHLHANLGVFHAVGVALIAAILVYEHAIVRPGDLSRLDRAFFDLNGYISLAYLACTGLDLWLGG